MQPHMTTLVSNNVLSLISHTCLLSVALRHALHLTTTTSKTMYVSFVRLLVYHVQEQQHALVATADIIYKTECVSQIAR